MPHYSQKEISLESRFRLFSLHSLCPPASLATQSSPIPVPRPRHCRQAESLNVENPNSQTCKQKILLMAKKTGPRRFRGVKVKVLFRRDPVSGGVGKEIRLTSNNSTVFCIFNRKKGPSSTKSLAAEGFQEG